MKPGIAVRPLFTALAVLHCLHPVSSDSASLERIQETNVGNARNVALAPDSSWMAITGGQTGRLSTVSIQRIGAEGLTEQVTDLVISGAMTPPGASKGEATSVAVAPDASYLLIAIKDAAASPTDAVPGLVAVLETKTWKLVQTIAIGIGPESIAIAPNGSFALVANEDEEDPAKLPGKRPGAISVLDLRKEPGKFTLRETLAIPAQGIEVYPGDPQPQSVSVAPDSKRAAVTLRENNAVALLNIDLDHGSTVHSIPLGQRDRLLLPASAGGAKAIRLRPEPDSVAYTDDGLILATVDIGESSPPADTAPVHAGGRSISFYDPGSGALLGDTGSELEKAVIRAGAKLSAKRDQQRRLETAGLALARLGERRLAFVTCDRADAIALVDFTDPKAPRVESVALLDQDEAAGYRPEGAVWAVQFQLLIVASENGAITVFRLVE